MQRPPHAQREGDRRRPSRQDADVRRVGDEPVHDVHVAVVVRLGAAAQRAVGEARDHGVLLGRDREQLLGVVSLVRASCT